MRAVPGPLAAFLGVALWLGSCEQVADSNNGEEHLLQFEPGVGQPVAVGVGASFEILAADPDGATCLAFASECVPERLRPQEIRAATCASSRCRVRVDGPDQLVVTGERAGSDLLEVEACFEALGCVKDRIRLQLDPVGGIRIDCVDDLCPGSSAGVLVGSRVRARVRLYGGVANRTPDRLTLLPQVIRDPVGRTDALTAEDSPTPVFAEVPFELRGTEGVQVSTEGEVPLEVLRESDRVLDLVLRPRAPGRAVLVASVGTTTQRFAFDAVAEASVVGLHLRVVRAIGFEGDLPGELPATVSLVTEGALESRLRIVPVSVDAAGQEVVGGADRFRLTESTIARIERDAESERFDLIISGRGRFGLVAAFADRQFRWTFDIR